MTGQNVLNFAREKGSARGDMEASWKISIKRGKFGGGPPGQRKLSSTGLPATVNIKSIDTLDALLVAARVK